MEICSSASDRRRPNRAGNGFRNTYLRMIQKEQAQSPALFLPAARNKTQKTKSGTKPVNTVLCDNPLTTLESKIAVPD